MKIRSEKHRAFVVSKGCIITGAQGEYIVPHHLLRADGTHGIGTKSCDMWCVPLHSTIHDALHRNGNEIAFFANHGLPYELVKKYALHFAKTSPDPKIKEAVRIWEAANG